MKTLIVTILTFLTVSGAYAGPISSGGTNQILERCKNNKNTVQLEIGVVNNNHLVAILEDYTSQKSSSVTTSVVHRVAAGYVGDKIKVSIRYVQGWKLATVIVLTNREPLVYQDLICTKSLN